jgi:hypothetical protein
MPGMGARHDREDFFFHEDFFPQYGHQLYVREKVFVIIR